MTGIIDAHHHIWRQADLPWLMGPMQPRIFGPYAPIRRDYTINEYLAGFFLRQRWRMPNRFRLRCWQLRAGVATPSSAPQLPSPLFWKHDKMGSWCLQERRSWSRREEG